MCWVRSKVLSHCISSIPLDSELIRRQLSERCAPSQHPVLPLLDLSPAVLRYTRSFDTSF